MGANPTPMNWGEVYLGLQQGAINGQENPLSTIVSNAIYEVQDTLVLTNHEIGAVCFIVSESAWQAYPEDVKALIQTAVDNAVENASNSILNSESSDLQTLKDKGMTVIEPDLEAFKAATAVIYDEYAEQIGEMVTAIQGMK